MATAGRTPGARGGAKVETKRPKRRSEAAIAEDFERTTGQPAEGRNYRAFAAQQRGESPESAPRRDDRPSSRGPRGRASSPIGKGARSFNRTLRRLGGKAPSKTILAELVAAMVIVTAADFAEGVTPSFETYVPTFLVYLVLSIVASFGGQAARVATALGALVLLALVMARTAGIVGLFGVAQRTAGNATMEPIG